MMILIFFFQAEDGIRDGHVTGVQTCALPIFSFRYTKAREPSIVVPWPLPPYRYLTGKWLFKKRRRFGICSRINWRCCGVKRPGYLRREYHGTTALANPSLGFFLAYVVSAPLKRGAAFWSALVARSQSFFCCGVNARSTEWPTSWNIMDWKPLNVECCLAKLKISPVPPRATP